MSVLSAGAENTSDVLSEAPTIEADGINTAEALLPGFYQFSLRLCDRIGGTSDDPVTQDFLIGIA